MRTSAADARPLAGGTDDVVALVRWANATGTTLVPRGSGTSMANGAVGPGVVVDLSSKASVRGKALGDELQSEVQIINDPAAVPNNPVKFYVKNTGAFVGPSAAIDAYCAGGDDDDVQGAAVSVGDVVSGVYSFALTAAQQRAFLSLFRTMRSEIEDAFDIE